jgi:hypothetical protein
MKLEGSGVSGSHARRARPKEEAPTARFLVVVIALSCVAILLGLYFINALFQHGMSSQPLRMADVAEGTLASAGRVSAPNQIKIFYTTNGRYLAPEVIDLPRQMNSYETARFILEELLKGPQVGIFETPIPPDTKLQGMYIQKNELVVDLSKEFRENFQGGVVPELLCVYSIVNSLILNCKQFERVQLLIEGQVVDTLAGNLDLSKPLVEDLSLIRW